MAKKIVCRCNDITEADLVRLIEQGMDQLETLKRYSGVLTGPCQGKMCAANVLEIFLRRTGKSAEELRLPTLRPPAAPIPLGRLAAAPPSDDDVR